MKEQIKWLLNKLRVTDEEYRLSLTNVVVFSAIYKLISSPSFDASTVATLITAVSAYQYSQSRKANVETP